MEGENFGELMALKLLVNFGGGKFWRINGSKVIGEEKFGKSVGSLLKTLTFMKILANCQPFAKFAKIFPLQNFPMYGINLL